MRRRANQINCGPLRFLHCANETETFARQCFDQALLLARVADCVANRIQAGCQRGIRDRASVPDGADEVILADDALPVADQVIEQIEHLGCDRDHFRSTM